MPITKTQLDIELEAAKTYIAAGNYQAARAQIVNAKITLTGMPDYAIGNRRLAYRDEVNGLLESISILEKDTTTARSYRRLFSKPTRD